MASLVFRFPPAILATAGVETTTDTDGRKRKRGEDDDGKRKAKKPRKAKLQSAIDNQRVGLEILPNELLQEIASYLDAPSYICLALTNKHFGRLSTHVNLRLSRASQHCQDQDRLPASAPDADVLYTFCSTHRCLLMLLRDWMPKTYKLCWICARYTSKTGAWSRNGKPLQITLPDGATTKCRVTCHSACRPRLTEEEALPLSVYCRYVPGARASHYDFGCKLDQFSIAVFMMEHDRWSLMMERFRQEASMCGGDVVARARRTLRSVRR